MLCLSGFELYSRWVPLFTDPGTILDFSCLNRSGKSHHKFSLSSLVGVIQNAGSKRLSQGTLGNKLNATTAEFTRPTSTQSVNTQSGKLN